MTDERTSENELDAIVATRVEAALKAEREERARLELLQTIDEQGKTIVTLATQCDELAKAIVELRSGQLSKESIKTMRVQIGVITASLTGLIEGAIALFGG